MHAVTHSLAHRAPPATRTRVRWQPYNSLPPSSTSSSSRSSPATYLNTPSSVNLSPSSSTTLSAEIERPRHTILNSKEVRDPLKQKYALSLVDQAVKSLCEIWHPQDIPHVFLTSSRATITDMMKLPSQSKLTSLKRNIQLPSPVSPSTRPSPDSPTAEAPQGAERASSSAVPHTSLVPIRGFVHEVLRRSRTSGNVLQTALCYLEAIRAKVPELVKQEKAGEGIKGEPEPRCYITRETDIEGCNDTTTSTDVQLSMTIPSEHDVVPTIRLSDVITSFESTGSMNQHQDFSMQDAQGLGKKIKPPSTPLPPLPPLPSPLLCPRRAFLASLILASKFTQDKCYSNRAWAKLSGLPAREIGRCERALGDALEWRLWVGKAPSGPQATTASTSAGRPVIRSRSDGALLSSPANCHSRFFPLPEPSPRVASLPQLPINRGLRRCATIPADVCNRPGSWPHTGSSWLPHPPYCSRLSFPPSESMVVEAPDGSSRDRDTKIIGATSVEDTVKMYSDSPSPYTPPLSHSPSSTESSSGDRTIQMAFLDESSSETSQTSCLTTWSWHDKFDFNSAVEVFPVSIAGGRPHGKVSYDVTGPNNGTFGQGIFVANAQPPWGTNHSMAEHFEPDRLGIVEREESNFTHLSYELFQQLSFRPSE